MTSFDKMRQAGFHADLVERAVLDLSGGVLPEHSVFNLETTFDDDSVFRHLDYVGLGDAQLIAVHLDELAGGLRWIATVVPLRDVGPIEVAQVLLEAEDAGGAADGVGNELMVHMSFGTNLTLELDQVQCDDPDCDYNHGYSGFLKKDGLMMRFEDEPVEASTAADAMDFVRRVIRATAAAGR